MSQQVFASNYYNEVSKGNVPGSTIAQQEGSLPAGTAGTFDVWSFGRSVLSFTPSTGATINTISSSSAADVGIPVVIRGLGANFEELPDLVVVLNGQNKVTLSTPFRRILVARNLSGTPTGTPVTNFSGNIYIYEDTAITAGIPIDSNKVKEHIPIGYNISKNSRYTVPAGKNLAIGLLYSTITRTGSGGAEFIGYQQTDGETRLGVLELNLQNAGSTSDRLEPNIPYFIPEKTDIWVITTTDTNGVGVSSSFRGEVYTK